MSGSLPSARWRSARAASKLALGSVLLWLVVSGTQVSAAPAEIPTAEAVRVLVAKEPITQASWPVWRERLISWLGDRSDRTNAAFDAARQFIKQQAGADGELPAWIAQDAFGWYMLGGACLYAAMDDRAAQQQQFTAAERTFRRSLQLDSQFARAHRNLAVALIYQGLTSPRPRATRLRREVATRRSARSLRLRLAWILRCRWLSNAVCTVSAGKISQTASGISDRRSKRNPICFTCAIRREISQRSKGRWPDERGPMRWILSSRSSLTTASCARTGHSRWLETVALRKRKRKSGKLGGATSIPPACWARNSSPRSTGAHRPQNFWRWAGWTAAGFTIIYLGAMALMALFGLVLASRTRGAKAARLLGRPAEEWVHFGQVARSGSETILARLYMVGLMAGLVLFYLAIPFLTAAALAGTGGLLYLIFMMPRIPIKLIVIVVVVGLGMAWAMIKSIFASTGRGSFGLLKSADDCPRLHETVRAVAERVDTAAVDQIYLAPGSAIGVHQEGRGPFGMFGVKQRVLTLGMSTMRYLTVSELKAILAHEYGHFSHKDTFYSRFIYQVTLSIEEALAGMASTAAH